MRILYDNELVQFASLPVGKQRAFPQLIHQVSGTVEFGRKKKKKTKMHTEKGSTIGFSPEAEDGYMININLPMVSEGVALDDCGCLAIAECEKGGLRETISHMIFGGICHVSKRSNQVRLCRKLPQADDKHRADGRKQFSGCDVRAIQGVLGDRQLMASSLVVYLQCSK